MRKIAVKIINRTAMSPVAMTGFLAKLTQRGHTIKTVEDAIDMLTSDLVTATKTTDKVLRLPRHGSILRHSPITMIIVGGSRRLLGQLRTHSIGIDWVSASLQYSNYSEDADFVIPYELFSQPDEVIQMYINKCKSDVAFYKFMIDNLHLSNDTAGYLMNQAMRNTLVCTANHEAWLNLIASRICHRNTDETSYVSALIWEELFSESVDGQVMFKYAGPDCLHGSCREGHMSCRTPFDEKILLADNPATALISELWPLIERS